MSIAGYLNSQNLARFPFAFVITYGRSGSTLLQGILNSIPGYCIRGENDSTLSYLFAAAEKCAASRKKVNKKTSPTHPWYGADTLDPVAFAQSLGDVFFSSILRPPEGTRCTGFKEIRYTPQHLPDELFSEYLDFIQRVFPGAALIFNTREVEATLGSAWWAFDKRQSRIIVEASIERFRTYAEGRPNCFTFSYDDLMADSSYCSKLFDFLGEAFDQERTEEILAKAHSYQKQQPSRQDYDLIIKRKSAELQAKSAELEAKSVELSQALREADRLQASINAIRGSSSWKIMTPLRVLRQSLRRKGT